MYSVRALLPFLLMTPPCETGLISTLSRAHAREVASRWRPDPIPVGEHNSSFWNPSALRHYVKATVELNKEDAHAYAVLYTRRTNDLSLTVVRQNVDSGDSIVSALLTTDPEFRQHAVETIVEWLERTGKGSVFVEPGVLSP